MPAMIDQTFWPTPDMFLDISSAIEISDGRARCTGVAICDDDGQPTRIFQQGQPAHFFYEFEILEPIDAPSGGLEFHNADNLVIHGKNSFQHDSPLPDSAVPGQWLRYHHVIQLEVGMDEYWFTVGLASSSAAACEEYRAGLIGHARLNELITEHCRVVNASSFFVQFDLSRKLQHHGIANLPSNSTITSVQEPPKQVLPARHIQAAPTDSPTIIHITHWKAGSQWIHKILSKCIPEQLVSPQVGEHQFKNSPIQAGKVYPTVYVTKQQFDRVHLPANSHHFVIIRDLRDTLISAYFSIKISHPILKSYLAEMRSILLVRSMEEGLIYLLDDWLRSSANIQLSWVESGEQLIRYEDLLEHDLEILEPLLIDKCRLPVSRERFREVVLANRFERLTRGRERGSEDITMHERKGIAGDWQNYFTEPVKRAFKLRYGGLLVATGYEQDLNW
jgi:hypothetical protein